MHSWPVVPICSKQRLDVKQEDLRNDGLYRVCNVGQAGAGYDKFPTIAWRRGFGPVGNFQEQFIVQLQGCPLACPYCYVTPDGVHGKATSVNTYELVHAFEQSGSSVFHLMGGAPAIYLSQWQELIEALPAYALFHSDFLAMEHVYNPFHLQAVRGLHALNIKNEAQVGILPRPLMARNIGKMINYGVNFYITFTGFEPMFKDIEVNWLTQHFGASILEDSFDIQLIDYKALQCVS